MSKCHKCGMHVLECICNKCLVEGCKYLQTTCITCGRLVSTATLPNMEWINVEQQHPEDNEWILGSTKNRVEMGVWFGEENQFRLPDNGYLKIDITHWMPLPPPPKND